MTTNPANVPFVAPDDAFIPPVIACPFDGHIYISPLHLTCPLCRRPRPISPLSSPLTASSILSTTAATATAPVRPHIPFRKVLYLKQYYPDNYVDETFLDEMHTNGSVRPYTYLSLLFASAGVVQHVCSIAVFIAVFILMLGGGCVVIQPYELIILSTLVSVVAYAGYLRTSPNAASLTWDDENIKSSTLIFVFLHALSPILKTLTQDTSSDTIWALSSVLFCVNALFHDYSLPVAPFAAGGVRFSAISTNAAIFASVMLASRLPSAAHVFALTSYAVEWFALFPVLRRHIATALPASHLHSPLLTLALLVLAAGLWGWGVGSGAMAWGVMGVAAFVTFACPAWLMQVQRYKNEIHGPWDEARPRVRKLS